MKHRRLKVTPYRLKALNCSSFHYTERLTPVWLKAVTHSLATSLSKPVELLSNPLTRQQFKAFRHVGTCNVMHWSHKASVMSNFLDGVAELNGLECPLQSPGVNPAEPPFVVEQEGGAVDVTPSPAQLSSRTKVSEAFPQGFQRLVDHTPCRLKALL